MASAQRDQGSVDGGFVFYSARCHVLFRVLAALCIGMLLVLAGIVPTIVLANGSWRTGIVLVAVMVLPTAVLCALLWMSQLWRFTVTSRGLVVRRMGRTRQIPWPAVDHLEVDRSFYWSGAVVVVLRDGRRLRSNGTSPRMTMHRGEPIVIDFHGWHAPARPFHVAAEIHQRYLAGEFDRELAASGLTGSALPR